jgi:hypothetical protein
MAGMSRYWQLRIDGLLPREEFETQITAIEDLDARVTTIEGLPVGTDYSAQISDLDTRVDALEATSPIDFQPEIDALDGRMDNAEANISALQAAGGGGGGGGSALAPFGRVSLDGFAGANDDAKLAAAITYAAAQTFPPAIQLTNRAHTFTTSRAAFEALRIIGPEGYSNPERNGNSSKMSAKVTLGMNGPWFHNNGTDMFSVSLHNLAFVGTGTNATVIGQSGGGTWYCLSMSGIYSSGLRSVIGTQATKVNITAASFTGDWEINNCYSSAFHIGGSDNALWMDGMLLDSGTAFNSAGSANGQAHLWCDSLDKTVIGPLYITCEGNWRGVRVSGTSWDNVTTNMGSLTFYGLRCEGRNPGAPCNGAPIRVEGGRASFIGGYVNYGMASPGTISGGTDVGIINHTGGLLAVEGVQYDRATGVGTSTPFVYTNTTGPCMVTRCWGASRGGAWGANKPIVAKPTANADNRLVTDASVTLANV